jgi:hypothetical protein
MYSTSSQKYNFIIKRGRQLQDQPQYNPGVYSASDRNDNQESSLRVKVGRRVRLSDMRARNLPGG